MKRIIFSSIFFSFVLASAQGSVFGETAVRKIIDGETLELSSGQTIRLIGIKTHQVHSVLRERFQLSADKIASLPLAQLSSQSVSYMESHVLGKNVILSYDDANKNRNHEDKSGRTLAYVWYAAHSRTQDNDGEGKKTLGITTENRLLNQELIMMGRALVDTTASFLQKETFLIAEKSAAKSERGFWRSAADLYKDLLSKASGAQFSSTAGFVTKAARKVSLESSYRTFAELIQLNPKDFRPYYERSWLGANAVHDQVTESNIQDIDQAIQLSPFDPKCYMHKSYLLALLGKYDEASQVYEQMTRAAGKLGVPVYITEMSQEKIAEGEFQNHIQPGESNALILDALRAVLNEDHFLIFMARYKSFTEKVPDEVQEIYDKISTDGRFQLFYKKQEAFMETAHSRDLLYKTQWALRGHDAPEEVIKWIETIGEAPKAA